MLSFKLPDRDRLGWLIPLLLLCVFYGGYLWFNETGFLRQAGVLFLLGGAIGLSLSRRVRRLIAYHGRPKTPERREAFMAAAAMDRDRRQAKKERVPELICGLYFDFVRFAPGWLALPKGREEHIVPSVVISAKDTAGNRTFITLDGREYIFTFVQYVYSTPEGEPNVRATLQVSRSDQRLILMHLAPRFDASPDAPLVPVSLDYALMGDWINDFRHLKALIDEERARRLYEDSRS